MKDDINYAEKIATFNLLVGNNNEDIAFNYLSMANWDETQAAILYNKENKGANATLINSNNNFILIIFTPKIYLSDNHIYSEII